MSHRPCCPSCWRTFPKSAKSCTEQYFHKQTSSNKKLTPRFAFCRLQLIIEGFIKDRIWNTIIRLFSFLIIAYATSKIRFLLVKERETAKALRDALSQIKMLSGLIPICASCKRIRDDKGYWNQLEAYLQEHSEAEFSHGICPDCMKKLYGVVLEEDTDSKKQ